MSRHISEEDDALMDTMMSPLIWIDGKGRKWEASSFVAHYLVREEGGFFTIALDGMSPLAIRFEDPAAAKAWAWSDAKTRVFRMLTPDAIAALRTAPEPTGSSVNALRA